MSDCCNTQYMYMLYKTPVKYMFYGIPDYSNTQYMYMFYKTNKIHTCFTWYAWLLYCTDYSITRLTKYS